MKDYTEKDNKDIYFYKKTFTFLVEHKVNHKIIEVLEKNFKVSNLLVIEEKDDDKKET